MSWESVSYWIEQHPGLASWVQAVGSVAAIAVAIWISGSENRHRARIEKATSREALIRATSAAAHAKKIAENNFEFFSCNHLPRREMPRYIAVVDAAEARITSASSGPGVDSEMQVHLYEVANALVDIKGLIHQCVDSVEPSPTVQIDYLRGDVERIKKALDGLRSIHR
jgi:hypothetical protein